MVHCCDYYIHNHYNNDDICQSEKIKKISLRNKKWKVIYNVGKPYSRYYTSYASLKKDIKEFFIKNNDDLDIDITVIDIKTKKDITYEPLINKIIDEVRE
jgi:predicted DNA-binding ArsR family transcriptional regulator